jgi:hypothetical protein
MKKRNRPNIPDFSRKQRPSEPVSPDAKRQMSARPPAPTPTVKPHATSQKSGRRGS